MNIPNFQKVFNNNQKDIYGYLYSEKIDTNTYNKLLNAFNNWKTISDNEIIEIKKIITNYVKLNENVKGFTTNDSITLFDNMDNHYYAVFNNNDINIWYINGCYDEISIDNFEGFQRTVHPSGSRNGRRWR